MSKAEIVRRVERITINCDTNPKDTLVFNRVDEGGKLKFIQLIPNIQDTSDTLLTRDTVQNMITALQEMLKCG